MQKLSQYIYIKNLSKQVNKHVKFYSFSTNKSLKLKRGSPLFYVFFETLNPDDNIRLIRAEKTKELADFRKGVDGIPKYLSNTFKIMETAKQRRPDKLLKPADKKNN